MSLVIIAGCFIASPALAAESSREVSDFTGISDGEGNSRFLLRAAPSIEAEHFTISRAYLRFAVSGAAEERELRLRLHSVTSPWSAATADWSGGWRTPGGDIDPDLDASLDIDLSRGATDVGWDVTFLMKEILEGGRASQGFLVTCDPKDGVGLRATDAERMAGLASARIEVRYRKVPPVPREIAAEDTTEVR